MSMNASSSRVRGLLFVLVELRCGDDTHVVAWTSARSLIDTRETRVGIAGRQWVIQVSEGMNTDDALRKLSITPADNDIVVVLRTFEQLDEPVHTTGPPR
jgi:hypothetical protein